MKFRPCWLLIVLLLAVPVVHAADQGGEKLPPLWGYGVNGCGDFSHVLGQREQDPVEYGRYQDWLTGFVSGLNLATGKDVLVGVEIKAAMRRIGLYCDEHPKDDFFTATMDLVRLLSQLR